MALQQLVGSGAECSTGNALKGLASQMERDRSLMIEQRRMAERDMARGSPAAMAALDPLEAEFMQARAAMGPSRAAALGKLPDQLAGMSLHGARPQPQAAPGDWASEFMGSSHGPSQPFEAHFEQAFRDAELERAWASPQHMSAQPLLHDKRQLEEMERIYHEASRAPPPVPAPVAAQQEQPGNWAAEYERDIASAWADEFVEQEKQRTAAAAPADHDQIASLAGQVVASVSDPKIQQSKFMDFMRQLRDRTLVIDGNQVVAAAAKTARDEWVSEFAVHSATDPSSEWADAFARSSERRVGDWEAEFQAAAAASHGSAHAVLAEGQNAADWAKQFAESRQSAAAIEAPADASQSPADAKERQAADWVDMYRKSIAPLRDATWDEWDAVDKGWERYPHRGFGYEGFNKEVYSTYIFQRDNAFMTHPAPFDAAVAARRDGRLIDAILAGEAEVQARPQHAAAWALLGGLQAENENDTAAIAALQKAAAADPELLEPWLNLAVSYANENCRVEAFQALHTWLTRNPRYASPALREPLDRVGNTHDQLVRMFLGAAREGVQRDALDADVQVALGVLFSMSSEYDKAADCFAAALQSRPDDYRLWNRLGACHANAGRTAEAIGAYDRSISINPSFVRARFNLGISCIALDAHEQAAEHFLTALSQQAGTDGGGGHGGHRAMNSNIWETLRQTVGAMQRPDLLQKVARRDLAALSRDFGVQLGD